MQTEVFKLVRVVNIASATGWWFTSNDWTLGEPVACWCHFEGIGSEYGENTLSSYIIGLAAEEIGLRLELPHDWRQRKYLVEAAVPTDVKEFHLGQ
jgi:hypothetical protein